MGLLNYVYSFFYDKKICEYCGKKYYLRKENSISGPKFIESHDTCSYNCSINLISNYKKFIP